VTKVRSHKVKPTGGPMHGRRQHQRAPRPGTTERRPLPAWLKLGRKPTAAKPDGGGDAKPAAKSKLAEPVSKPIRLGAIAAGVLTVVLAVTVLAGAAGSPLLIAGVILVIYGARPRGTS